MIKFSKRLVIVLSFVAVFTSAAFAESLFLEQTPMGYFYFNKAETAYQKGDFQTAMDNYILASKGFHEEGNVEMQSRSYDKFGKAKLRLDSANRDIKGKYEKRSTARY